MKQEDLSASSPASVKSLGQYLRQRRLHRGLSQEVLAEAIGVSARSIRRWEQDQAVPQEVARERLCQVFGIDPRSWLGAWIGTEALADTSSLWHIPISRNPFFNRS